MKTLDGIADFVSHLNPFALAALVCAFIFAGFCLVGLTWLFIYGARSGAGETNDGEIEAEDLK